MSSENYAELEYELMFPPNFAVCNDKNEFTCCKDDNEVTAEFDILDCTPL